MSAHYNISIVVTVSTFAGCRDGDKENGTRIESYRLLFGWTDTCEFVEIAAECVQASAKGTMHLYLQ